MTIRSLFDPNKNINRTIEKVIAYAADDPRRLKAEITEYVVTEKIEDQFHSLLSNMQLAMETGAENEIGVWVSGFYGSGKSSFTKYLGLAFDERCVIEGTPFLKYLQDRLHKAQTRQLLSTVAQRFPAAVVMLDLASEMLAGATMEDVTTVLYFKVLKWAGYSDNVTLAALELKAEKDGKRAELDTFVSSRLAGKVWADIHNDPLAVSALAPLLAHQLYPVLFPTPHSFTGDFKGWRKSQDQQIQEMLDIVREKSGKKYVLFVIDEVGQYVAARSNLILNLDGLAKNLKLLGNGKAWIIGTAQQTLTEDDPRASLNSPQLFKLKDRFPIRVTLESSDIKEICYRRLLGKSPAGAEQLGKLFDAHGQALRQHTKLEDAKYYEAGFNRESFINLYPFLPAHFDILLHLLGALAKSTGGIGLRSAIKVIQDVLKGDDGNGMADQPVGWLATTVTLYNELERDLERAFPSVHQAVGKVGIRFPDGALHQDIAKSVAVLQILGNLPVTVQNVASLMHPAVDAPSQLETIRAAVEELLSDVHVPLGEKDGRLVFQSEKLRDIAQERAAIALRTADIKRLFNEALREAYAPLPRVNLQNTYAVTTGLKLQSGASLAPLAGESYPVQTIVEFVAGADYEAAKTRMLDDSRSRTGRNVIGLVSRMSPELDDIATDMYRCQRIVELHRNDPDQEIKEYCNSQTDRAETLAKQLQSKIRQALQAGSFVFRGQATAVATLDTDLLDAAKKLLGTVAEEVFDRYAQAPVRVDTDTAEKFLKVATPTAITTALDPLEIVQVVAGKPKFRMDHLAIVSIRDHLDKHGTVEGQRLLDTFSADPYGWSPDTTRYLLAAMLMAGEIKLKVSGREVTAIGQQAIDALKTNRSFKSVGVALRGVDRPSTEAVGRAAERLSELSGESVIPLEQDVSKAAVKCFVGFQREFGPLAEKLDRLKLAGADRIRTLNQELADCLFADASDATQRLGAETSALFENLAWARAVVHALGHGLESTIQELNTLQLGIGDLPDCGVPGDLRRDSEGELAAFKETQQRPDFHQHATDFNNQLTELKARVREAVVKLQEQQAVRIRTGAEDLQRIPEWVEMTQEERNNSVSQIEAMARTASEDMSGLKQLLTRDFEISSAVEDLKRFIRKEGQERIRVRVEGERAKKGGNGPAKLSRSLSLPSTLSSAADIDALLKTLQEIKAQLTHYSEVEVRLAVGGDAENGV